MHLIGLVDPIDLKRNLHANNGFLGESPIVGFYYGTWVGILKAL